MIKALLPILLLLSLAGSSQNNNDTIKRFYNKEFKQVMPDQASFYSIYVFKDGLWTESRYDWLTEKLAMYGAYKDSSFSIPVDTFFYFHTNQSLAAIEYYADGKKERSWLKFHENKMMKDSTAFLNDKPINISLSWHDNGMLSDSVSWSEHFGQGFVWTGNGNFIGAGQYNLNRRKHGAWKYYHPNGKVSTAEVYNNDTLLSIKSYDETGNPIPNDGPFTKIEVESSYKGGQGAWANFLNNNLQYPKQAIKEEIQGTVVLQFVVNEHGAISNIERISGHPVLAEEGVRLLQKSGKWNPALFHGVKVKTYKRQPIVFSLD